MGWRHFFEPQTRYRAKIQFESSCFDCYAFLPGETLVFDRELYSHYDGVSVYEFHVASSGEKRIWYLHDSEPDSEAERLFEKIP